jgi:hypothetical protein
MRSRPRQSAAAPPPVDGFFAASPLESVVVDGSPVAFDPELSPESLPELELELECDPGLRVAARSFFAHPEPLNTIAGGAKPLRSDPSAPHSGQNRGTGSWIPWRISVFCPQLEQVYS